MQKEKGALTVLVVLSLAGCGGGSGDSEPVPPPPPPNLQVAAGLYDTTFESGNTITDSGVMAVDGDGNAIMTTRNAVEIGLWKSGPKPSINFTRLLRGGIPNENTSHSPAAWEDNGMSTHTEQVEPGTAYTWQNSSTKMMLKPTEGTVVDYLTAARGKWAYSDVIPFDHNGTNVQYSISLTVADDLGVSGSDSTGCTFTGLITPRTGQPSQITLSANFCGEPLTFIENGTYDGMVYLTPGQPLSLTIAARKGSVFGLSLTLTPN